MICSGRVEVRWGRGEWLVSRWRSESGKWSCGEVVKDKFGVKEIFERIQETMEFLAVRRY